MKRKLGSKILGLLLALVLAFCQLPSLPVFAATGEEGVLKWMEKSDGTLEIIECKDKNVTSVTIPDQINGKNVTSIGDNAFKLCQQLESIEIPSEVTSIGIDAFFNCIVMKTVTFEAGSKLTTIGKSAFKQCSALESIEIPAEVTVIFDSAFESCEKMKTVTFKAGSKLTTISDSAFYDCSVLEWIEIPSEVISIGNSAFKSCKKMKTVTFKEGSKLTTIGESAFEYCPTLKTVTFKEGSMLTTIGESAFHECSALESIEIPSEVISIGNYAFESCQKMKTVTFKEGSKLTTIGESAFSDCYVLEWIEIPSEVTSIGNSAFSSCGFKTVTFKEGSKLTAIGEYAFQFCNKLESIEIPSGVKSIGVGALSECTSLNTIAYIGTKDAWENLKKDAGVDRNTIVHCMEFVDSKSATCTEDGVKAYYKCSNCSKYFEDKAATNEISNLNEWKTGDGKGDTATGHSWGKITYTWDTGGKTCTAKRVCETDNAHFEEAHATVDSAQSKAPTCNDNGNTIYTATFNIDWAENQTKTVNDIAAIGHKWGEPIIAFSEEGKSATAIVTCQNDEKHTNELESVEVTSKITTPGTCSSKGTTTYTAKVTFGNREYTATTSRQNLDIDSANHNKQMVKIDGKEPTNEADGWKDYFECSACGKFFEDEKGTHQIDDLNVWKMGDGKLDKIDKLVYAVIEGNNSSWQKNTDGTIIFRANGDFAKFIGIKIDGDLVAAENYTAKSGSTIVTMKKTYLQSLGEGSHTIEFLYKDGTCEANFTVIAEADTETANPNSLIGTDKPMTGDESYMILWLLLGLTSVSGLVGTALLKKKLFVK